MITKRRILGALLLGLATATVWGSPATTESERKAQQAIVELSKQLGDPDVARRAKGIVTKHDSQDISSIFVPRRHGGLGTGKLAEAGFPDGIEGLLSMLSRKPLEQETLKKHRGDLVRVVRIIQAMAELAPHRAVRFPPGDRRIQEWQDVSARFKARAQDLRDALMAFDTNHIRLAARELHHTCCDCHSLF